MIIYLGQPKCLLSMQLLYPYSESKASPLHKNISWLTKSEGFQRLTFPKSSEVSFPPPALDTKGPPIALPSLMTNPSKFKPPQTLYSTVGSKAVQGNTLIYIFRKYFASSNTPKTSSADDICDVLQLLTSFSRNSTCMVHA